MDFERFENKINEKFKNFEPEVNDTMIWDKIEGDLPSKKKRQPFWLFGFLLVPAVLLVALNVSDAPDGKLVSDVIVGKGNVSEVVADLKTDELEANESTIKELSAEGLTESAEARVSETREDEAVAHGFKKDAPKNLKVGANLNSREAITREAITLKNDESYQASLSNNVLEDNSSTFAQAVKKDETSKDIVVNNSITFAKAKKQNEAITVSKNVNQSDVVRETIDSNPVETEALKVINGESLAFEQKEDEEKIGKEEAKIIYDQSPSNEGLTNGIKKEVTTLSTQSAKNESGAEAKGKKRRNEKNGSISFTTGVFLASRTYEESADEQVTLAIAEKETAEKQLETLQFDLQYKYRVTEKFAFGIGLRQWKHTESSTHKTERAYQDMIDVVTGIIHHVDGTTEETYSSVPVFIEEQVENTRYQTHASWSVPLKIYYTLNATKKMRAELGLGYELSFSGKHVGYELGPNNSEYFITLDPEGRYAKNGGSFLLANFNTNYRINKSIEFTTGLEGKYGLNGFNTAATIYRKKYHFLGLYAGLNYTF